MVERMTSAPVSLLTSRPSVVDKLMPANLQWPSSPVPNNYASDTPMSARQRRQVYDFRAPHVADVGSLSSASVHDASEHSSILEHMCTRRTVVNRPPPMQVALPQPRDLRITMNMGHGAVFPQRGSSNGANLTALKHTDNSSLNSAASQQCVQMDTQDPAVRGSVSSSPHTQADGLTVFSAASPESDSIPAEFRKLSTALNTWDCRDQISCSSRRRWSTGHQSSSDRKMQQLQSAALATVLGRSQNGTQSPSSQPQSRPSVDLAPDIGRQDGEASASYLELLHICMKAKSRPRPPPLDPAPLESSTMRLGTSSPSSPAERKAREFSGSPSNPFFHPCNERKTSMSPRARAQSDLKPTFGDADRLGHRWLCQKENTSSAEPPSPRRTRESQIADILGQQSRHRPHSADSFRFEAADAATCSSLDTRGESRRPRSCSGRSSPRHMTEKNHSDLFGLQVPQRLTKQERAKSPELRAQDEEKHCWEARIGLEMSAEIARRVQERILTKNGSLGSPREAMSASERKRNDMSSGAMRIGMGDSPRTWDNGHRCMQNERRTNLPMRMRSMPHFSPRQPPTPRSSSRQRYIESTFSNIF